MEKAVKAAAEKGYVRSATDVAGSLYESAKNKAPTAVKSTIEKVIVSLISFDVLLHVHVPCEKQPRLKVLKL